MAGMGWMKGWDSLSNKGCKPRQEPESSNVDALCIFKASRSLAKNGGTISRWWLNRFFYFHPLNWENNPIWLYNVFQMGWNHQLDFVGNKGGGVNETKWAPYDRYKWNDNTYKWPCKRVTGNPYL